LRIASRTVPEEEERNVRTFLLAIAALGAVALLMVFAVGALADNGHGNNGDRGHAVFESSIAPSVPADPMIHGVAAAGAAWVISEGEAKVTQDGRFKVEVEGLVLTATGMNPVPTISASLYCGADTNTTATVTTPTVPFSMPAGDAEMEADFTLPAKCLAPVVLLHPRGGLGAYIGASGFQG
jgi:hypothetical protein